MQQVGVDFPGPGVSFSPNPVNFGSQIVGTTSSPETVTLSNSGNQPLSITNIAVSGDYAQASSTCNPPQTLAAGTGCTLSVTFTPTQLGSRAGSITVTDSAFGSPHTVALSGTGTDFTLRTAAGGSTSATVSAGGTATYNLSIAPTGFAGTVTLSCSGAPARATCAPSTMSLVLDGVNPSPFTVSVTTTARSLVPPGLGAHRAPLQPGEGRRLGLPLLLWLMVSMTLLGIAAMPRQKGRVGDSPLQWARRSALAFAAALLITMWVACGGGGGGGGGNSGTPPGTYTLTVTPTPGGASRSLNLTLTVN